MTTPTLIFSEQHRLFVSSSFLRFSLSYIYFVSIFDVAECYLEDFCVCSFVLAGLSKNSKLKNLDLNLSAALGSGGSQSLECIIGDVTCIGSLDISDNGR